MCPEKVHQSQHLEEVFVRALFAWILLWPAVVFPASTATNSPCAPGHSVVVSRVAGGVSIERQVRRWVTRTERLFGRVFEAAQGILLVLVWLLGSSGLFAALAAAASTLDSRLLGEVRDRWAASLATCWRGMRLFWKAALDRALPLGPRLVLAGAWIYWVSPVDLAGEDWGWIGYVDDGAVAAGAARLFLYLCPTDVLKRHAEQMLVV